MPKPTKGARLGGSPAHQKLMLANLATSLFMHGRITTTEAKARRLRPFAEKLVTHAKQGDLHHRREVMKIIRDKNVVHTLFAEIGPFFAERPGGYTRIIKAMPRKGDNAPMAIIELLQDQTVASEADRARRVRGSQPGPVTGAAPSTPVATPPADEVADDGAAADVEIPAEAGGATAVEDQRADEAALEQETLEERAPEQRPDVPVESADVSAGADQVAADEQVSKDSPS